MCQFCVHYIVLFAHQKNFTTFQFIHANIKNNLLSIWLQSVNVLFDELVQYARFMKFSLPKETRFLHMAYVTQISNNLLLYVHQCRKLKPS